MNRKLIQDLKDSEIPLLPKFQLEFLDLLNSEIENIVLERDSSKLCDDETFDGLAQNLQDNLKCIIKNLGGGRRSRQQFCSAYPEWKQCREDGIQQLLEIAKSINTDRRNCNVSKIAGYVTSFTGGGLSVASAIAIPFTLGLSTPLVIAGGVLTTLGVGTAVGTSVTECVLLKKKVKKAKRILEKDQKYFQEMSSLLQHAKELQSAVDAVLKIDIFKDIYDSVKDLVSKALKIPNPLKKITLVKKILDSIFCHNLIHCAAPHWRSAMQLRVLVFSLAAFYLLFEHGGNRLIFDCAALTVKSIVGIVSLVDGSMQCMRLKHLLLLSAGGNALKAGHIAQAVTRGVAASIGIALDVAGVALASLDLHHGSCSPQAKKITEAAEALRKEATLLEEVYETLS